MMQRALNFVEKWWEREGYSHHRVSSPCMAAKNTKQGTTASLLIKLLEWCQQAQNNSTEGKTSEGHFAIFKELIKQPTLLLYFRKGSMGTKSVFFWWCETWPSFFFQSDRASQIFIYLEGVSQRSYGGFLNAFNESVDEGVDPKVATCPDFDSTIR